MLKIIKFFKKPHVGVEFKPGEIRLVWVGCHKQLLGVQTLPLATDAMSAGYITDFDTVFSTLEAFVQSEQLQGATAAMCLSPSLITTYHLTLPLGAGGEVSEAEVMRHLELEHGMHEVPAVDFTIRKHPSVGFIDVDCVLANQAYVAKLVDYFHRSGLALRVIEVENSTWIEAAKHYLTDTFSKDHAVAAGLAFYRVPAW